MNKRKHPVLISLLLVALGLVSTYLFRVFHFSENYTFVQKFALLICSCLTAVGGVILFLYFINQTRR